MNKKIRVGFYVASFLLFPAAALIVGLILLLQVDEAASFDKQSLQTIIALGVSGYLQFAVVQTVYNFALLAKILPPPVRDVITANDKPDFSFFAKEYYDQIEGAQFYEAKSKKQVFYAGKIIEPIGKVKQIGSNKHYLEAADMKWVDLRAGRKKRRTVRRSDSRSGSKIQRRRFTYLNRI